MPGGAEEGFDGEIGDAEEDARGGADQRARRVL